MRTIAFHSYKGGVGRSRLLAEMARLWAGQGLKVVALDLHLEAPGLAYKFFGGCPPTRGLVGWMTDTTFDEKGHVVTPPLVAPYLLDVPLGGADCGGWLRLMAAGGNVIGEYFEALHGLNVRRALDEGWMLDAFVDLRDALEAAGADLLLVDASPGMTHMAKVATTILADDVVVLTGDSPEHMDGTRTALRMRTPLRSLQTDEPLRFHVALARSTAPVGAESELTENLLRYLTQPTHPIANTVMLERIFVLREWPPAVPEIAGVPATDVVALAEVVLSAIPSSKKGIDPDE